MNGPEHVKYLQSCGIEVTAEDTIRDEANRLIQSLYVPSVSEDGRLIYVRDQARCDMFGIEEEPINWGDLKCFEVKAFEGGGYLVTIDEASPDGCETFCEFIRRHLSLMGWECDVQTEW